MIQRTAFKALLEHKGQLCYYRLTCLVESLSIVGQAWFFGTLINNFIFSENTLLMKEHHYLFGYCYYCEIGGSYVQEAVANRFG